LQLSSGMDVSDSHSHARTAEHVGLVDVLARTSFAVTAVLSRVGAENDLSLTQLRLLAVLRDRRLRISELADVLGLEKSTLSGLVDRAEKRDLVERAANQADKRAVDVGLSPNGAQIAERLFAQVAASLTKLTGMLETREQEQLRRLLASMLGVDPEHL
jgi:DNA-binding MarR family transcriptional regulator